MFQSLAQFYGNSMIAILLTGMGKDGVAGMQEIERRGGLTIAQDKDSSVIFIGVIVSILLFVFLSALTALLFRKKEVK